VFTFRTCPETAGTAAGSTRTSADARNAAPLPRVAERSFVALVSLACHGSGVAGGCTRQG
jgi:hypothetical protein